MVWHSVAQCAHRGRRWRSASVRLAFACALALVGCTGGPHPEPPEQPAGPVQDGGVGPGSEADAGFTGSAARGAAGGAGGGAIQSGSGSGGAGGDSAAGARGEPINCLDAGVDAGAPDACDEDAGTTR